MSGQIPIHVTQLSAEVPEGIPIEWQERTFNSGPIHIELAGTSRGVLDYDRGEAEIEFHVSVCFPELAEVLETIGASPEFVQPVRAVLQSRGKILDDHSFALSGTSELQPHPMFVPGETAAAVLPGT